MNASPARSVRVRAPTNARSQREPASCSFPSAFRFSPHLRTLPPRVLGRGWWEPWGWVLFDAIVTILLGILIWPQVGRPVGLAVRAGLVAGISDTLSTIRELHPALHHSAQRAHGHDGRADRAVRARAIERRVLPDRIGDAHRTGQQERYSDCRIRRTVAPQRPLGPRSRGGSGAHPPAAHPHDLVCFHPRSAAAGVCQRRRSPEPSLGRHRSFRRHDRLNRAEPVLHSGAVRHREVAYRAREGAGNEQLGPVPESLYLFGPGGSAGLQPSGFRGLLIHELQPWDTPTVNLPSNICDGWNSRSGGADNSQLSSPTAAGR